MKTKCNQTDDESDSPPPDPSKLYGTTSGKVKHEVNMEFEDWRLSDDCDFS